MKSDHVLSATSIAAAAFFLAAGLTPAALADSASSAQAPGFQGRSSEQQVTEYRAPVEPRPIKKIQGLGAQSFRFIERTVLKQDQGLIKIDEGKPGFVILTGKDRFGLSEKF